eukprot:TRINITY_DN1007_c0_g1_i2.p1 TRINITY_DN1007_c0_g1~~TRINITY_DN1007_c0_g1_i2.p1  ORF type:complete len:407 (+),score=101.53 TRINITY_DN1007_c0_g1_i2:502-1722(+)
MPGGVWFHCLFIYVYLCLFVSTYQQQHITHNTDVSEHKQRPMASAEVRQKLEEFIHLTPDEIEDMETADADFGAMLAALQRLNKDNDTRLKESNVRNVIFLGRTRSGKTTALQTLRDPFVFAEHVQLFSQTTDPRLYAFTMHTTEGAGPEQREVNYNISLIDTPGLYEKKTDLAQIRDDAEIKHLIMKCIEFQITTLHCLFFVCSFDSGINPDDVKAIVQLNKLFAGANKQFHLLITRSEGKLPSAQRSIEAQVRQIEELKPFLNEGVKIFFLGSNHIDDYNSSLQDAVRSKTNNVLRQRAVLFQHIFDSSEACHIKNMQIFKETNRQVEDLAQEIRQQTAELLSNTDGQDADAKEQKVKELKVKTDAFKATVGRLSAVTSAEKIAEYKSVVDKAELTYPSPPSDE